MQARRLVPYVQSLASPGDAPPTSRLLSAAICASLVPGRASFWVLLDRAPGDEPTHAVASVRTTPMCTVRPWPLHAHHACPHPHDASDMLPRPSTTARAGADPVYFGARLMFHGLDHLCAVACAAGPYAPSVSPVARFRLLLAGPCYSSLCLSGGQPALGDLRAFRNLRAERIGYRVSRPFTRQPARRHGAAFPSTQAHFMQRCIPLTQQSIHFTQQSINAESQAFDRLCAPRVRKRHDRGRAERVFDLALTPLDDRESLHHRLCRSHHLL